MKLLLFFFCLTVHTIISSNECFFPHCSINLNMCGFKYGVGEGRVNLYTFYGMQTCSGGSHTLLLGCSSWWLHPFSWPHSTWSTSIGSSLTFHLPRWTGGAMMSFILCHTGTTCATFPWQQIDCPFLSLP